MPFPSSVPALVGAATCALALSLSPPARADDPPAPISAPQIRASAREYYASEMTAAFLFVGYGAITGAAGGVTLAQSGDFARGFGWSSLIGGGLNVLGGLGYAAAVKIRGDRYTGYADTDLVRFKEEEGEHIGGTNRHFVLYLGFEVLTTLAGVGLTAYGLAAKDDLWKGIGLGTAIQGIGLFVIDVPGALRAAKYDEEVRRFNPQVGVSMGGGTRPWAATVSQAF